MFIEKTCRSLHNQRSFSMIPGIHLYRDFSYLSATFADNFSGRCSLKLLERYSFLRVSSRSCFHSLSSRKSNTSFSSVNIPYDQHAHQSKQLVGHHQHETNRYQTTFHTRPLPSHLISLSSSTGKQYFREALAAGNMESFFPLSEQFITQSEPFFCSVSSLAMTLNALKYDPKKVWKGAWRWVSEETLLCESSKICGHDLENIKSNGMNFTEFEALGECHGISIQSIQLHHHRQHQPACAYSIESFRQLVQSVSSSSKADIFIIANFSRRKLGQTGDGHYSPIGGYHPGLDLVLIMDVARFKYPPFWVSLRELWDAMAEIDVQSGQSRGYFVLSTAKDEELALASGAANHQVHNHNHHHHEHSHRHEHSHSHRHEHSHSHRHHGSVSSADATVSIEQASMRGIKRQLCSCSNPRLAF
jgi:hypothetical protein